jgi:protein disulfide-isomerase-like protein
MAQRSLRSFLVLLLVCLSLAASVWKASASEVEKSDVVVLDDEDFDQHTAQGDWFLEFYAPWCGHCKRLTPVWDELAVQAKAKGLHVGKVDCTQNKALASRFKVGGYPTIQFLKDKKLYAYKGPRQLEDFLKFAEDGYKAVDPVPLPNPVPVVVEEPEQEDVASGSGPSVVQILTSDNFTLATSGGKWFVKFMAPWCGHCKNLAPTWEKAAAELQGKVNIAKVDCTTDGLVCQLFEVKGYPTLKYFKGDGFVRDYTGVREVADFAEFVRKTHKQATPLPYPLPSFLMSPITFKLYKALEPVAAWINENVGYSFAIVAALSIILGFLLGRLSVGTEVRYVIPKELAPQWNELLAQKKAQEQKKQERREQRAQKKNTGEKKKAEGALTTSNDNVASSPRRKRSKGKKPSSEKLD